MMDEKIKDEIKNKESKKRERRKTFEQEREKLSKELLKSDWILCAFRTERGFSTIHLRSDIRDNDTEDEMELIFKVLGFLEYLRQEIFDSTIRAKLQENRNAQANHEIQKIIYNSLPDEIKKKIKEGSN